MTCPVCSTPSTGGRFCSSCGAPFEGAICPACRSALTAGAKFCHRCGTAVGATGSADPRAASTIPWAVASIALALVLGNAYRQAAFFVWFFYNAALESSREQSTVGKRIFGMIVCGVDGRRLTFARAAIRTLAKVASLAICGMGFVMPLLTPKKQALHDLMTDAVVVLT